MKIEQYGIQMKKIISAIFLAGCLVVVASGLSAGNKVKPEAPKKIDDPYKSISLLMDVMELVREKYVDSEKVTYEKLIHGALKGMLQELDPYSIYEEPKYYKNTVEQTRGSFGGLGIVVTKKRGYLEVVSPMEDTPGFRAGLQAGDQILEINGKSTRRLTLRQCVNLLKGPPQTNVKLKVYHKAKDSTSNLQITRERIKISPIKGAKIIDDGIGYIRIVQFSAPVAGHLQKALKKMKKQKLRALVLDLRGNPGGLLSSAVQVCSLFIDNGKLVVYTEGRNVKDRQTFNADSSVKYLDIPMTVLIDNNSASASEIVAGCLKDHKRAVLVGEKSYGKGSVQTIIPLMDRSAIRFTTAKYYTPSKRVIHDKGIDPDIPVEISRGQEFILARQRAMFPGQVKPDPTWCITDVQLQRAMEILKGICLFSENGKSE